MANKNLYFDFEYDRVVTLEGEITRQYKYFARPGYTLENFAEENFMLISDDALDYYISTYGAPENPKPDRPSALVAEGLVPDIW